MQTRNFVSVSDDKSHHLGGLAHGSDPEQCHRPQPAPLRSGPAGSRGHCVAALLCAAGEAEAATRLTHTEAVA